MSVPGPRVLVLPAAGTGSRLGSSRPKVLHPVAGRPMLAHLAALHRPWIRGHGSEHRAVAEELGGVLLVLLMDDELCCVLLGQIEHRGQEPVVERVRVHRDRQPQRVGPAADRGDRLQLQQRNLAREPSQRLTRLRRPRGLASHHHDLTEPALQCLDPLAHRRRRDVQPSGSRVDSVPSARRRPFGSRSKAASDSGSR